jgi:DNA-binding Lrp family transcriptional regulator
MSINNTDRIKSLSRQTKIPMKTIAEEGLGMSPQSLSNRLRRNNLTEDEMIKIAKICGVTYKSVFVTKDGDEI